MLFLRFLVRNNKATNVGILLVIVIVSKVWKKEFMSGTGLLADVHLLPRKIIAISLFSTLQQDIQLPQTSGSIQFMAI